MLFLKIEFAISIEHWEHEKNIAKPLLIRVFFLKKRNLREKLLFIPRCLLIYNWSIVSKLKAEAKKKNESK